jgi:hypothetical protein
MTGRFKWLHSVDNLTVRSGPIKSGSEKEEQIKGAARSRRHWHPADRGGADSSRPSGAGASRHSHQYLAQHFLADAGLDDEFIQPGGLKLLVLYHNSCSRRMASSPTTSRAYMASCRQFY